MMNTSMSETVLGENAADGIGQQEAAVLDRRDENRGPKGSVHTPTPFLLAREVVLGEAETMQLGEK